MPFDPFDLHQKPSALKSYVHTHATMSTKSLAPHTHAHSLTRSLTHSPADSRAGTMSRAHNYDAIRPCRNYVELSVSIKSRVLDVLMSGLSCLSAHVDLLSSDSSGVSACACANICIFILIYLPLSVFANTCALLAFHPIGVTRNCSILFLCLICALSVTPFVHSSRDHV